MEELQQENKHWVESDETAKARIEQVQSLKEQAAAGGLRCNAYLTPSVATWILEMVERGEFVDPSQAIHVFLGIAKDLQKHPDIKRDLLRKQLDEGIAQLDRGEATDGPAFMKELKERMKNHVRTPAAVWKKIEQPKNHKNRNSLPAIVREITPCPY